MKNQNTFSKTSEDLLYYTELKAVLIEIMPKYLSILHS